MLRLFIENRELDVDCNEDVVTTHALNKIGDISSRDGIYSNVFKLPKTERNIRELELAGLVNSAGRLQYKRTAMRMETEGLNIEGFGTITSIDSKINVRFMASNYDWGDLIGDRLLSGFDYPEADHLFTDANINASRESDTMPYSYPNADYGFGNVDDNDRTPQYLKPWYRVKYLIKKIFEGVGFSFVGNIENDVRYSQTVVFKGNGELLAVGVNDTFLKLLAPQEIVTQPIAPSPSAMYRVDLDNTTNPAWNNISKEFVVPQWGDYKFTFNVTFLDGTPADYVGYIEIDAGPAGLLGFKYFGLGYDGLNSATIEVVAGLTSGIVCTLMVACLSDIFPTMNINSYAEISLIKAYPESGQLINTSFMLPNMKAKDFIKSVVNTFGILLDTDRDNMIVKASKFDDVLDGIPDAVDFSKKISLLNNPDISYDLGYAIENYFRYTKDEADPLLKMDLDYGTGSIVVDDDGLSPTKDVYTSPFSPTKRRNAFRAQDGNIQEAVYIPIQILNEQAERIDNEIKPRIAYIVRDDSCILRTVLPLQATQPNLYFEGFEWNNLIQENYELLTTVLKDTVVVKAEFLMRGIDIENINFSIPIYIDHFKAYFYLDSVNQFNHTKRNTTSITLIKIIP